MPQNHSLALDGYRRGGGEQKRAHPPTQSATRGLPPQHQWRHQVIVQGAHTLSYFQAHPLLDYVSLYSGSASSTIFSQPDTVGGDEETRLSRITFVA